MRSIRRFMTMLIVSALVLVIFSAALHGYRAAMDVSSELMDKELESVLATLAMQKLGDTSRADGNDIAYQLWQNSELVTASSDAPTTPIAPFKAGYADQNFNGQRWRVNAQPLNDGTWIMVAQPMSRRYLLAERITESAITPFILIVPVLALFVFVSISFGLSPLKRLSSILSQRKGKDLAPVTLPYTPDELTPVQTTLNSMFVRLNDAFEREQQFASNAAHELRTPLSVMKINLHNLSEEMGDQGDKLAPLKADTNRMIHAVNQILLLSRTNPELFQQQLQRINIEQVAQQVIADLYGQIDSKRQEIELLAQTAVIQSSEFTLYTLLQNLIANASHYSPERAQILVSIKNVEQGVLLSVEDSGPGIPEDSREKVLSRFHRNHGDQASTSFGSGLGLAIVGQIVRLHQARITLGEAELGGLAVRILFPIL